MIMRASRARARGSIVALTVLAVLLAACSARVDPEAAAPSPTLAPTSEPAAAPTTIGPSPDDAPFVFAVKGDWGAGTEAQRRVTRQMCEQREAIPFDVVMTVGDNFYERGTATRANYADPERCLYARADHRWHATWGNHDQAEDTRRVLGAEQRWYSWTGDGVEVFMLDSNRSGDAIQRAWLEDALASSTAPVKIAAFHHPPFTVGSVHDPSLKIQRDWVPLFRRHGVRMVFAGHNHLYEHLLIDGIDYVTTGGGGAGLYRCARTDPGLRRCVSAHHFLLVLVEGERIEVRAIDPRGNEIDRFVSPPA